MRKEEMEERKRRKREREKRRKEEEEEMSNVIGFPSRPKEEKLPCVPVYKARAIVSAFGNPRNSLQRRDISRVSVGYTSSCVLPYKRVGV
jgi:mRNA deadenylase 3'-5' endonuclease subunit Ccr4